ncbi:MAG: YIP1 family protein [Candidatus Woesearchaeota archaeon]
MAFFDDIKTILTNPKKFFMKVKDEKDIKKSMIFFLKIVGIYLIISFIFDSLIPILFNLNPELLEIASILDLEVGFLIKIIAIFFSLFSLVFSFFLLWGLSFVIAGIYHVLLMIFGTTKSYIETYKLYCYWSPMLLILTLLSVLNLFLFYFQKIDQKLFLYITIGFIILFYIIYLIYSYYVLINGAKVLHELSTARCIAALIVIPWIIIIFIASLIILFFISFFSVSSSGDIMTGNFINNFF